MTKALVDFRRRVNPLGTPDAVRDALLAGIAAGVAEPFDADFTELREMLARRHSASVAQIAAAQTEEELITLLLASSGAERALLPFPCPPAYTRALGRAGVSVKRLELQPRRAFRLAAGELKEALSGRDLLLMGNPAFPSGALIPPGKLIDEIADWLTDGGRLILDERAVDFTYGSVANSLWSAVRNQPRTALIRSFTSLVSLSACPLCYAVGDRSWIAAARARQFHPALPPLAACLTQPLSKLVRFRSETVDCVSELRERLIARLRRVAGLRPLPSDANWVLCRLERGDMTADDLAALLRRRGVFVGVLADGRHFYAAVRAPAETDRLVRALREILMPKNDSQRMLPLA